MKKFLGVVLALASITVVASSAEASTSAAAAGQVRVQIGQGRRHRPVRGFHRSARVVTRTRIVQRGRQRFRETYQVIYRPDGGTQTRVINRVRIG